MKKKLVLTILILLSSMMVFAVEGEKTSFVLLHELGPRSSTYGLTVQLYNGSSRIPEKILSETTEKQYVGELVGVITNMTREPQVINYIFYWTPFFNKDGTQIDYTMDVEESTGAGESISYTKPKGSLGYRSMQILLDDKVVTSKKVSLFNLYLTFTDPNKANGLNMAGEGSFEATLVLEVLPT